MTEKKVILSTLLAAIMISCSSKNDEPTLTPPPTEDKTENNQSGGESNTKTVWMLTTTSSKSYDLNEAEIEAQPGSSMATRIMKLNPNDVYQEIDGFGSAITYAAAYNILKMSEADRKAFLKQTFSPTEGYGMSYVRVPIGCSDFSPTEYSLCDKEGIENFVMTNEETQFLIPVLKEILSINPELKVMGSPWTAPRWMKVNNLSDMQPTVSWRNGHLNPKYYEDYGTYFVKWIQAMNESGIPIYAVTPQNEPLNGNNSAGMIMYWDEERDFIKNGLGPKLEEAGLGNVKIYAFDHNYNYDGMSDQKSYPLKIYEDADASKYIAGAAYHNYGGDRNELNNVHKASPDKELVFTEWTDGEWNDGNQDRAAENVSRMLVRSVDEIALGVVNNWCRGSIMWNLVLDENHGPYSPADGSCKTGYGTVDLLNNGSIRKNAFYYAMAHLSSVAQPGSVRIGTTGNQNNVVSAAFKNPDGTYGLVLLNKNSDTVDFTVSDGDYKFPVTLPANSVVSLKW